MPKLLTQGVSLEPKTGRQLIGIVAGFKSERWPVIDRNAGRLQLGIRTPSKRKKADTALGTMILRNMAVVMEREREKCGLTKKELVKLCEITTPYYFRILDATQFTRAKLIQLA
ncbi:hypothetical protein [Shinella sp.]|jgi:hypothetical protein|uniref:hypothetical protein n=1 Tax=Shinella sp. TaxID=1870904 RepID=UPI003F700167